MIHTNVNFAVSIPAMQAVMKQATVPAIRARMATEAKSSFRLGAIGVNPPSMIPIDPIFAKPQRA